MKSKIKRVMDNQFVTMGPQLILLAILFHLPLTPAIETAASMMIFLGLIAVVRLVLGIQTQGRLLKSNLATIVEIGTIAINMAIISTVTTVVNPVIPLVISMICTVWFAFSLVTRSLFMLNLALLGHGELAKRRLETIMTGPRSAWAPRLQIIRDISMRMSEHHRINGEMVLNMAERTFDKAENGKAQRDEFR